MSGAALPRSEVPAEQRWNDRSVFADGAAVEAAIADVQGALAPLAGFRGTLGDGPDRLATWFERFFAVRALVGKLGVYAGMAANVDSRDPEARTLNDRVRALAASFEETTAFARPELLAIGVDTLQRWCGEHPELATFGHYVRRLARSAPHTRDAATEELLAALTAPFATPARAHGELANRDLDFGEALDGAGGRHAITQASISRLLASEDRTLRRSAYERYADAHRTFGSTMATLLAGGARQTNLLARARRYDDALAMTLGPDALPREVVTGMLDVFRSEIGVWHRYWRARRAILGVDELHPWDTFAPLQSDPPAVPYERAVGWLVEALRPLGDDYVETLRRGALEQGWVDRAPNTGKRMGAFSSGVQGTHPFILMSWNDDVFGMSTLAHELGHSLHSYLTWRSQPPVYSSYGLFVAEVASNFNQAMLRAWLWEKFEDDRRMRLAILEEAMANFYRYFFVMPTLARFELWLHEAALAGEALTADTMDARMAELFAEGYGDTMTIDRERVGITWAQFHTHLYARFYVYQYATGISGAHALAERVRSGEAGAAEAYRTFLAAGGSGFPLDVLRAAGVDLASRRPVEATFAVLERWVTELEAMAD